jgi:hypothetical protein
MKCISIKQPYAELILTGRKRIELRNWNILNKAFHLYIHVPNMMNIEACKRYRYDPSKLADTKQSIMGYMVIGYLKEYNTVQEFKKDRYLHLSDQYYRYGFVIVGFKRMRHIRNVKGQQKVFTIN